MSLFVLHELQVVDAQIDQLKQQIQVLPEKKAYEEAKSTYLQTKENQQQLTEKLKHKKQQQKKVEAEVAVLTAKISQEEKRLYGGQVTNVKELQALQMEVKALKRKQEAKEDELLTLMEEAGLLEEQNLELLQTGQKEQAQVDLAQEAYEQALAEINGKLAKLTQQREELLHSVSPQDLKLYEQLRQEKKGVAVVNLHGSTCAGCHLELSASDIDKVYTEPYWRCPHCQRIIVRTGERR